MEKRYPLALILTSVLLTGCTGSPGYWFHILFIIIPLIAIGNYLYKKLSDINESIYVIEGQLKRLISRIEQLEKDSTSQKKKK